MLLSVQSLEKRYESGTVFSGVTFTLEEGHRIALVGKNGVGKSTILKIVAGMKNPDTGSVTVTKGKRIAHLPQEVRREDKRTGEEYLVEASLLPHQYIPVLEGLGVSQETVTQPLVHMSGGQQTKILLARFLLEPSDILLLDEPTNNLDIPSLLWLESFLASSKKAMIVISHDLVFLNKVANRVFELRDGGLTIERGTYGDYIERKKKEVARKMKEYRLYRQKIAQLEQVKQDLQEKGGKIDAKQSSDSDKQAADWRIDRASRGQKGVKVLKRRIERMEKVEKPVEDEPFVLKIPVRGKGDVEVKTTDLFVGYDDKKSVGPLTLTIKQGDKLCFMGQNGVGKSTLLKTLVGALDPVEGSVSMTEGVVFGDLMQQHERINARKPVLAFFTEQARCTEERGMHLLKQAGFTDQMVLQNVLDLSSGMRARLLFSIFVVQGVSVLVLDEPTNHLDIEGVAALKELLKEYTGSVLLVSHNRWFFEELQIDLFYKIEDGGVTRIQDFEGYVQEAQARAEVMVKRLRRVLV